MQLRIAMLAIVVSALGASAELYEPMDAPFVAWVEDGQARARIVTDDFSGGTVQPAQLLNEYIGKIAGTELPIVERESAGPDVFLGPGCGLGRLEDADEPDLGREGFVITSDGEDLVIAGRNRLSTLYGVCAFLEECLGVRWLWAGESGEYVPRASTLRVGNVHKVQRPASAFRWVGRGDWALRNRMNVNTGQPEEFKTKWFVHTFLALLPPEKYWPEHKDYYALRGGERVDPTTNRRAQLCTSNPEVVDAVVETIEQIMAKEPNTRMISVDPEDSQSFCQCENCTALDEPDAPYARRNSRRLAIFYNQVAERVAEKHPDLLLKSIAYHTYVAPPADPDITMHDNVVIQFCRFQCHNHALYDADCPINREFNEHFRGWNEIARHVIFYEYYYKVSWLHLPWPIVHILRRDLPYLRDQGVMGISTQYTSNFASNGLAYYVAAKLLWDPDLDVDELVADFCDTAYGSAAEPMLRYHQRLERAAIESGVHLAGQRPYADVVEVFTPEVMADLDAEIAKALEIVSGERARRRVELMAAGLEYTHLVVDYLRSIERLVGEAAAPWQGEVSQEVAPEAAEAVGQKAEKVRQFIESETGPAIGSMNNYIKLLLTPQNVMGQWRSGGARRGEVRLTKGQWREENRQWEPPQMPDSIDLWIYGNDLDFVEDKPEHRIYAVGADGDERPIGSVGTRDRPGNRHNRGYVIRDIERAFFSDGILRLVVTNDAGGPYASHFFAFYAMPSEGVGGDEATGLIKEQLEGVRERAYGFTEYGYRGLSSDDGDRDEVTIELHVRAPTALE